MFFVIGENAVKVRSVGCGETLQDAITNWSEYGNNPIKMEEEFYTFLPEIFKGECLTGKVNLIVKTEIHTTIED